MPRKKEAPKKEKIAKKEKVVKEKKVKVEFDDFKDEVYKYTDDVVRQYYLDEIEKVNRAYIREKNKKILFRNFIITLLLLVIVFLLYLLTTVNYFSTFGDNTYKEDNTSKNSKEIVKEETPKEEKHEPSLSELKETYGFLLDKVIIYEKSKYLKDYYNGNLTNELKNYLALNNLDFKKLDLVDNYNMFSGALLKDSYEELFTSEYESVSFNYNDNAVRYISKLNAYITNEILNKTKSNIKREITNISVDGNKITIMTVEGLIKDGKLYNVTKNEEINDYHGDSIITYVDRLNKVTYTFDNKKLISIK